MKVASNGPERNLTRFTYGPLCVLSLQRADSEKINQANCIVTMHNFVHTNSVVKRRKFKIYCKYMYVVVGPTHKNVVYYMRS